jgi:hypothetical protein
VELSTGLELVALGIQGFAAVGGLAGIAAILNAFFRKHNGKSVRLKYLDTEVELKGMSATESAGLVTNALRAIEEQGKKNVEEWKRLEQE